MQLSSESVYGAPEPRQTSQVALPSQTPSMAVISELFRALCASVHLSDVPSPREFLPKMDP